MTFPAIDELIPHRPPMRLLDQVESFDRARAEVRCSGVLVESPLVRGGEVRAVASLEMMAQAAAACTGLLERGDGAPARGWLVAVPTVSFSVETLRLGDRLEVIATRVSSAGATASFECEVARDARPIASARLLVVKEGS